MRIVTGLFFYIVIDVILSHRTFLCPYYRKKIYYTIIFNILRKTVTVVEMFDIE
jgi:hypothetical protein